MGHFEGRLFLPMRIFRRDNVLFAEVCCLSFEAKMDRAVAGVDGGMLVNRGRGRYRGSWPRRLVDADLLMGQGEEDWKSRESCDGCETLDS